MNLTPEFSIVDYQATPSGYYQIAFRDAQGQTVVVTQHGRGGSNVYSPWGGPVKDELDTWLSTNAAIAVEYLIAAGFADLATGIKERENEWQDSVVLSLCDLIDMGKVRVQG